MCPLNPCGDSVVTTRRSANVAHSGTGVLVQRGQSPRMRDVIPGVRYRDRCPSMRGVSSSMMSQMFLLDSAVGCWAPMRCRSPNGDRPLCEGKLRYGGVKRGLFILASELPAWKLQLASQSLGCQGVRQFVVGPPGPVQRGHAPLPSRARLPLRWRRFRNALSPYSG